MIYLQQLLQPPGRSISPTFPHFTAGHRQKLEILHVMTDVSATMTGIYDLRTFFYEFFNEMYDFGTHFLLYYFGGRASTKSDLVALDYFSASM
jgi:hypothetical protein